VEFQRMPACGETQEFAFRFQPLAPGGFHNGASGNLSTPGEGNSNSPTRTVLAKDLAEKLAFPKLRRPRPAKFVERPHPQQRFHS
jgi:hypothetical protein